MGSKLDNVCDTINTTKYYYGVFMSKPLNLIYGISGENKLVHISDVESGKACDCKCPACNTPLIAKKGTVKIPHFAHQSTKTCEYGFETSLHMAAKEILATAKFICLPEVVLKIKGTWREKKIIPEKEFYIDRVELENKTGNVIPDLIIYSGNEKIFVEIFVTHKVDEFKYNKIKQMNISTLEIDLSQQRDALTVKELEKTLTKNNKNKYWIYHSEKEIYNQTMYSIAQKRRLLEVEDFFDEYLTRDCPLRITKIDGYYCAPDHYCYDCKYCIERNEENGYILCTGDPLIGDVDDFDISLDERITECINWLEEKDIYAINEDFCPYCWYGILRHTEKETEILYKCINCNFIGKYNKVTKKLYVKTMGHKRKY